MLAGRAAAEHLVRPEELEAAVGGLGIVQQPAQAVQHVAVGEWQPVKADLVQGRVVVVQVAQQEAEGEPELSVHIRHLQRGVSYECNCVTSAPPKTSLVKNSGFEVSSPLMCQELMPSCAPWHAGLLPDTNVGRSRDC